MREVDLAEEKSAGIVVDESRCLRAVRGNGAALLLHRLVIDVDPETASDWINLSRGWERMSPDDILEQSDFPDATLDLTRSVRTPRGRNGDRAASRQKAIPLQFPSRSQR